MNFCVVLSGGVGNRMSSDIPKQYMTVNGRPILIHTIQSIQQCSNVNKIIIVAHPDYHTHITNWIKEFQIQTEVYLTENGDSRQESILQGLKKCMQISKNEKDVVIIHDAVRPFISVELIDRCLDALTDHDGALPVIPVKDTLYYSENGNQITDLLNRDKIYAGQAPEAFLLQKYYRINENLTKSELECIRGTTEIAFRHNFDIALVAGEEANFKITTPEDFELYKEKVGSK